MVDGQGPVTLQFGNETPRLQGFFHATCYRNLLKDCNIHPLSRYLFVCRTSVILVSSDGFPSRTANPGHSAVPLLT